MSDIDTIRALIADLPVVVEEVLTLDGIQVSARTRYFPVIASSVTVTLLGTAPTVDEQSGLLTWATAQPEGTYLLRYSSVQLLDVTLTSILSVQGADAGDVDAIRLAAANALDVLASSQALIQRRIQLLDMKTDGVAVAQALRAHAEALRQQVAGTDEPAFDLIEQINDAAGYREKVLKDFFRESD